MKTLTALLLGGALLLGCGKKPNPDYSLINILERGYKIYDSQNNVRNSLKIIFMNKDEDNIKFYEDKKGELSISSSFYVPVRID